MKCYLCGSSENERVDGKVRDNPSIDILRCKHCGFVFLSSSDHVDEESYSNSQMHETEVSIEDWIKNSHWDDQRRLEKFKDQILGKNLLDFGCGAGGFLYAAKSVCKRVEGVELESRVRDYWVGQINIQERIEDVKDTYDVITAFHVIEHLHDPVDVIKKLSKLLSQGGRLILEVPNADDALLSLYNCNSFKNFTYWSKHLYLFNSSTFGQLAKLANMRIVAIQQYQRYPLSNHLYWLSNGVPGGHSKWPFLDSPDLEQAYSNSLARIGKCDTLICQLENY